MHRLNVFFVVFGLVVLVLVVATHTLLYHRLAVATQLPRIWQQVLAVVLAALAISLPVGLAVVRMLGQSWLRGWAVVSFVWMGLLFLLLVGIGVAGLLGWGHDKLADLRGLAVDPERRLFLSRLLAGSATGGALLAGTVAVQQAWRRPELRRVEVPLAKLPKSMDGLKIVQISDVHVGPTIRREWVEALVAEVNASQPDVIALTGDFVDGSVEELADHVAPFAGLQARLGVFFVTGNHEYFSGVESWLAHWRSLGVRVLRNECVTLRDRGGELDVLGVDDWSAQRMGAVGHGHDLQKALQGRDPARPSLLLAHQPKAVHQAAAVGIDLQLSGHTHGGQIWPFNWLVLLQQPYVAGLYKHSDTWIYVSRGAGFWGPPMRLAAPSEVTQVVLRAGS